MASIWNSPWDKNNDWYNKMLASGQYWNDFDLSHASQDQNFANTIFQAKSDYANATTDEGRALANANAEAARQKYNYTSGTAGAEYNPLGNVNWSDEVSGNYRQAKSTPSFSYESFQATAPFTYDPYTPLPDFQHSDAYNKTMADVLSYDPFSYDYSTDPLYAAYSKEYTREGRRASEDALAQAAAMTGGVPSSYANTAAQQAGNYYAAQLADKIPELRNQAYGEWQGNFSNLLSKHNVAANGDQFDYGVYSDKANRDYQQYLDDLNMRYGIYSDDYNRGYQQWADKVNLDQSIYNNDWNRNMDLLGIAQGERNIADADRLAYAKMVYDQTGDPSLLDAYYGGTALGDYAAQQAALAGQGGPYTGDVPRKGSLKSETWHEIAQQARQGGKDVAAALLAQWFDYLDDEQINFLTLVAGLESGSIKSAKDAASYAEAYGGLLPAPTADDINVEESNPNIYQSLYNAGVRDYNSAVEWLMSNGKSGADAERLAKGYDANRYGAGSWTGALAAGAEIDRNSLASLGFGDLTPEAVAEAVADGWLIPHVGKNGKITFTVQGRGR